MSDQTTTVLDLKLLVREFVDARQWRQFHTPKNLTMSLAIESAELMEHFQWLTPEESRGVAKVPDKLRQVGEEMADVLCYLLAMSNELELDISQALRDKLVKNARKYPVEEYRGRFGADDPGPAATDHDG